MIRIYLAGPEVFLPDAAGIGAAKKELCRRHGLEGLFPLDNDLGDAGPGPFDLAARIFDLNRALIRSADVLIANMTPFRGPSMDVGTAFEVGFADALGRPVYGYANVEAPFLERVAGALPDGARRDESGRHRDAHGMEIEDFGLFENLMIGVPVCRHGPRVFSGSVPHAALYTDLAAFEACLRHVAERFGAGREQT
ncbi:Nucleoside 2-deoxyribosyltransferase [Tistlia consotensis]|uniref:Nucleoside 2-deoxyribosyltransferase n=1 Tax=Tistlia consotensis USBA 355 TaxID=560819 RepID=A0A1Y6CEN9_9PROT|nr:nucleoside 2-deoxyribosyltransferase [Tistlia consotensis]SMF60212.1 Nucleoside 2-deoxyribosyltransferase [Tistlia consotensis USBA 355]SNR93707.1 Nucleoside 2-deoxyribosyltransferase [Tistlia consotensis]